MGATRARLVAAAVAMAVAVPLILTSGMGGAGAAPTPRHDYIVVLRDAPDSGSVAAEHSRQHQTEVRYVYRHALSGYAATMTEAAAAGVARDPRVRSIEVDQVAHTTGQTVPTGVRRIFADDNPNLGVDGVDDLRVDVDVAVIDTGVDLDHPDLNVNVAASVNCLNSSGGPPSNRTYSCAAGGDDDNGHGSHVGGTIGALDNGIGVVGVAPGARLWAIKVLDSRGSGAISAIVAGIDYVTANAGVIDVANMSLGCECSSSAMDTAITNSVAKGVTYAAAAGNNDKDASTFSPANHPDVITVSALADFDGEPGGTASPTCRTDQDDTLADFSNFGSLVEITAPGVCILSTVPGGGYDTFSGTSMASPHVAGAAALLASTGAGPASIRSTLINEGNFDWTDDSGDGIKEPLLDVGATVFSPATVAGGGGGGGGTNATPTALFTAACPSLACAFDGSGSSDSDGTVASYAWGFGDSSTGSGVAPSHTYAAGGTYTVTLTVTDDDGATGSSSQSITVSGPSSGISLSVAGYKVQGLQKADLSWSGATTTNVDIRRNDVVVATTANDGFHTDNINRRGSATYTYQVCEAGTSTCSPKVTVTIG